MSSATVQTWIGKGAGEIANASIIRELNISPSWQKVNIGMWFSFTTGSQTNLSGAPRLYFGLCSGSTNVIGDATTDHFVGCWTDNTAGWTYSSSSAAFYEALSPSICDPIVKSGTEIWAGADLINTSHFIPLLSPGSSEKSCIWILQITKGSPLWTFRLFFCNGIAAGTGYATETDFVRELQSDAPASTATINIYGDVARTLAVDEAASGSLTHLNIAWDREEPDANLLIHGVGVSVVT